MMTYRLRLCEDNISANAQYLTVPLGLNCIIYVVTGELTIRGEKEETAVKKETAAFTGGPCKVQAGPKASRVLRFELFKDSGGAEAGIESTSDVKSRILLESPIELDQSADYVMRCDRVDFELGSEALPHGHRGGGIRWLIAGELMVKQGEGEYHAMQIGEAWFEDGKKPVHAIASKNERTAFIRVSILPLEIKGKSSIMYVNPEDAGRSKPRTYALYVDELIEI
ncbi:MAG: hypothetical protein KKH22_09760 [Proteobacteria bacterium]|nr:hypothetical protein [Pseudomonadota bacterium]